MPSIRDHVPLAIVTIVLSVAMFILFREVRTVKAQTTAILQQPPMAFIPQLQQLPASAPDPQEPQGAQGEPQTDDAKVLKDAEPLPPPVAKLPSKVVKAKA